MMFTNGMGEVGYGGLMEGSICRLSDKLQKQVGNDKIGLTTGGLSLTTP